MKKKSLTLFIISVFLMCTYVFPVSAQMDNDVKVVAARDSALLPPWKKIARDIKNNHLRGTVISTGVTEIANNGGGDIQIALTTLAHKDCDEIRHKAYLDRWDDVEDYWYTVDTYDFKETKADHPDEDFNTLTTSFVVLKQPTGHFYRVRAVHMATYGGRMEVLSSQTEGILITEE